MGEKFLLTPNDVCWRNNKKKEEMGVEGPKVWEKEIQLFEMIFLSSNLYLQL